MHCAVRGDNRAMTCASTVDSGIARLHSARLTALIAAEISGGGPISFERFMDLALYAPGLGYYSAGAPKFGADGDFVTAPELGDVFAHCIARAIAPALAAPDAIVVEPGGGSGALAADLLRALERLDALPARYALVEVSADLRERQRARIALLPAQLRQRVFWLDAPPTTPWQGALVANEVVDALPVRAWVRRDDAYFERRVTRGESAGFAWCEVPADAALQRALDAALPEVERLPQPFFGEARPWLAEWVKTVIGGLENGLALFVDYGGTAAARAHPAERNGSLAAYSRHRVSRDVLADVGLADLTADVDFSQLGGACRTLGFDIACYARQGRFLIACGLGELIAGRGGLDAAAQARLGNEIRTLTMPGAMGERFKALVATKGLDAAVLPFASADEGLG